MSYWNANLSGASLRRPVIIAFEWQNRVGTNLLELEDYRSLGEHLLSVKLISQHHLLLPAENCR